MPLSDVPAHASRAEALGYDGLVVPEAVSDGILVALLALEHTERPRSRACEQPAPTTACRSGA